MPGNSRGEFVLQNRTDRLRASSPRTSRSLTVIRPASW
jgi:hypothetical protein